MNENEITEKITQILDTTPKSDDFYFLVSRRIIKEVIKPELEEVRAIYTEMMFKQKAKNSGRDH